MVKLLRIFTLLFLVALTNASLQYTTAQCAPQLDLDVAEAQGLISYEARGRGAASGAMIDLTVTNLSDSPIEVVIPPGMRFIPIDALQSAAPTLSENQKTLLKPFYAQVDTKQKGFFDTKHQIESLIIFQGGSQGGAAGNRFAMMFSCGSVNRPSNEVVPLQHETQTAIIEAYCINAHLDNPSDSTFFRAVSPPDDDLTRLMNFYSDQGQPVSLIALQIATWIITDDVDMDFLIAVGYEPTDAEFNEAISLLLEAGIDISNKKLAPKPTLTSPADGTTTTNPQPTLTWTPARGAVSYDVALDLVNGTPPPGIFTGSSVGTTFKPATPLYAATYYWSVRGVNSKGIPLPWSATRSFTVSSVTNAAPALNLYTTHQPTLTWNPVSWTTAYQVEISKTSNFTGTIIFSNALSPDELWWVTDYLDNGTWFWRVRARKENGVTWGSWSGIETFLVLVP